MIIDIVNSKVGKIIISILWGLGLACLFRTVCKDRSCMVIKAPNYKDFDGKTYKHNDKCYKYIVKDSECSNNAIGSN
jgi:hypothetical protein